MRYGNLDDLEDFDDLEGLDDLDEMDDLEGLDATPAVLRIRLRPKKIEFTFQPFGDLACGSGKYLFGATLVWVYFIVL